MKKNPYEEYERERDLKWEKEKMTQLKDYFDEFKQLKLNQLDQRIDLLKKIVELYHELKREAVDIDEEELKRLEEELKYREFKREYEKELGQIQDQGVERE